MTPAPPRGRPPPRRRRRLARLLRVAVAFVAGVALGEALRDGQTTGTQTLVRTLWPFGLVPILQTSVTLTSGAP